MTTLDPPMGDGGDLPAGTVRSAGGVVVQLDDHGDLLFLIRSPRPDHWSLPKGHLEPGETLLSCALREVAEETGYQCEATSFVGTTEYTASRGRPKTVWWWLMKPLEGSPAAGAEAVDLAWLPFDAATDRVTYEREKYLLAKAAALADSPQGPGEGH